MKRKRTKWILLFTFVVALTSGYVWHLARQERLRSPPLRAIEADNPPAVLSLLKAGANPNARYRGVGFEWDTFLHGGYSAVYYVSALMEAVEMEDPKLVHILVDQGADINALFVLRGDVTNARERLHAKYGFTILTEAQDTVENYQNVMPHLQDKSYVRQYNWTQEYVSSIPGRLEKMQQITVAQHSGIISLLKHAGARK